MLRRWTRAGVPVLNRRKGRPAAFKLSVRALAACIPSGPDAYHASPTKILPPRLVPVAMTTHLAPYSPLSWVTTPLTLPLLHLDGNDFRLMDGKAGRQLQRVLHIFVVSFAVGLDAQGVDGRALPLFSIRLCR